MKLDKLFQLARRAALVLSGEVVQSALHFTLSIGLLKFLSVRDYGVFTLVMVTGAVGLTYVRSLASMPSIVYIARSRSHRVARLYEGAFSIVAAPVGAVAALAVVALLDAWSPGAALAGAAFVALWCVRFHLRSLQFGYGRRWVTIVGDYTFASTGALLAGLALWQGDNLLRNVFLALAAANLVGAVLMQGLAREAPALAFNRRARRLLLALTDKLFWSGITVSLTNLQGQGVALLVAHLAGPQGYAPIAAVLAFFAPIRTVFIAMGNFMQPEMSAALARGETSQVLDLAKMWTLSLGSIAFIYGLAACALVPYMNLELLRNEPVYLLSILAWGVFAAAALSLAPRVVIEAMMAFRFNTATTAISAVIGLGATALALKFAPSGWALVGAVLSEGTILVGSWIFVLSALGVFSGEALNGHGLLSILISALPGNRTTSTPKTRSKPCP
jgi:hypothetical protein